MIGDRSKQNPQIKAVSAKPPGHQYQSTAFCATKNLSSESRPSSPSSSVSSLASSLASPWNLLRRPLQHLFAFFFADFFGKHFANLFATLNPVQLAFLNPIELANKMFRNETLGIQLKDATDKINLESYKIKSKLVTLKQEQESNLINIENMIMAEAKQIIKETQKASKETYRQLENEGCENIEFMDKILEEIQKVSEYSLEEKIKLVQKTNVKLQDVIEFSSNLELQVKINRVILKSAIEKLKDGIYIKSGNLNSKDFAFEFPEYSGEEGKFSDSKSFELKVRSVKENTSVTERLLENMIIKIENIDTNKTIKEASVLEMFMDDKVQILSEKPVCLSIEVKRPKGTRARLSVSILGSNMFHSPLLYHFGEDNDLLDAQDVGDSGIKIHPGHIEEEEEVNDR